MGFQIGLRLLQVGHTLFGFALIFGGLLHRLVAQVVVLGLGIA
jgi:hypothetical protein